MKIIFLLLISFLSLCFVINPPPTVSVNYTPKKQWKLSKHDLADIKLDIESEVYLITIQIQYK